MHYPGGYIKLFLLVMTNFVCLERLKTILVDSTPLFHYDTTHSTNYNGFPVPVLAVSDKSGRTHPLAIGICSHERKEDVSWFFTTLKSFCTRYMGYLVPWSPYRDVFLRQPCYNMSRFDFQPKYVMGDGAHGQFNGVKHAFGDEVQYLMCFFHVLQAVSTIYPYPDTVVVL